MEQEVIKYPEGTPEWAKEHGPTFCTEHRRPATIVQVDGGFDIVHLDDETVCWAEEESTFKEEHLNIRSTSNGRLLRS